MFGETFENFRLKMFGETFENFRLKMFSETFENFRLKMFSETFENHRLKMLVELWKILGLRCLVKWVLGVGISVSVIFTVFIRPFEKRSYYVIPPGVRPSFCTYVCPSVNFFVSV